MILLLTILSVLYAGAILWLFAGVLKLKRLKEISLPPKTRFSILIPFRNEAENLAPLLQSIQALDYPTHLYEVIFIDDHSHDSSRAIIENFEREDSNKEGLQLIIIQNKRKSQSPKKDAITTAIELAENDWILCTDADGRLPPKWLQLYDQCIQQQNPKMVCAPVVYPSGKGLISTFQKLDGLSLQGVTMGAFGWKRPLLCNGANMGYLRQTFEEVNGYEGNDHVASGDDVFLLEKFRNHVPNHICFLLNKAAAVETRAESSWKGIIRQRIRWASKTSRQSIPESKILGVIVFMGNLAFLASLVAIFMATGSFVPYLVILLVKLAMDYLLLNQAGRALHQPISLWAYLFNAFIYPLVTVWVVMASLRGTYRWKERTFQK